MGIKSGQHVCITGAATGIGRATAIAFARKGAMLYLCDIQREPLTETCSLVEEAGGEVAQSAVFDISDRAAVQAFAAQVHEKCAALDILINNAGLALFAQVQDMTHEHWKRIIDVDLWGPIHGIECFVPAMIAAQRGHIVNIASTAGLIGLPWHAAYSAAKFGLVGMSEVLRYDLEEHHIGVSVICPGAVKTPIMENVNILNADRESPEAQQLLAHFVRLALTPERVAEMILEAVEKKRFLVITSRDIKGLYFLRKFCPPLYRQIMRTLSKRMNAVRKVESP